MGVCARQHPEVFKAFLEALFGLDTEGIEIKHLFVFHNWEEGKAILAQHASPAADVVETSYQTPNEYLRDESTHHWTVQLVRDMANMRNSILDYAVDHGCDAVFMVDSDLLLQPRTLQQLWASGREVIAEVFWTRWQPDGPKLPNAWDFDQYGLLKESLRRWRKPGQYRVGGAGACTLIRASAIRKGLSYSPVPSVTWFGEDRALQLRAAVLGIPIFLDTHYPAYHVYRVDELPKGREWYASVRRR